MNQASLGFYTDKILHYAAVDESDIKYNDIVSELSQNIVATIQYTDKNELCSNCIRLIRVLPDVSNKYVAHDISRAAFKIARYLSDNSGETEFLPVLLSYLRDDLFVQYTRNMSIYLAIVQSFYENCTGFFPKLNRYGYRDVEKILGETDFEGSMDIHYLDVTYKCTLMADHMASRGYEVENYNLYKEIATLYHVFREFADKEYGTMSYNQQKANKVYKKSLKKPRVYKKDTENELEKHPIWLAMAYATARITQNVDKEYVLCKMLGYSSRLNELDVHMREIRKQELFRLSVMTVVGLAAISIGLWLYKYHKCLTIVLQLLVIAAIEVWREQDIKISPLWYVGYRYIGPAYWFYNKW